MGAAAQVREIRFPGCALRLRATRRLAWRQEVEESPFERVFAEIATEISIEHESGGASRVELTAIHRLRGRSRFGGFMARRAARRQLDAALDGLDRALAGAA